MNTRKLSFFISRFKLNDAFAWLLLLICFIPKRCCIARRLQCPDKMIKWVPEREREGEKWVLDFFLDCVGGSKTDEGKKWRNS